MIERNAEKVKNLGNQAKAIGKSAWGSFWGGSTPENQPAQQQGTPQAEQQQGAAQGNENPLLHPAVEQMREERRATVIHPRLYEAIRTAPIVHFTDLADPMRVRDELLTIGRTMHPPRDVMEWTPVTPLHYIDDGLDVPRYNQTKRERKDANGVPAHIDPATGQPRIGQDGRPMGPIIDPFVEVHRYETLMELLDHIRKDPNPAIYLLPDFHLAMKQQSSEYWQIVAMLKRMHDELETRRKSVVMYTQPGVNLPEELNGLFISVPNVPVDKDERGMVVDMVAQEQGLDHQLTPIVKERIVRETAGMTALRTKQFIEMALTERFALDNETAKIIEQIKREQIVASGMWEPVSTDKLDTLVGYDRAERLIDGLIESGNMYKEVNLIALVGQAGTGKTTFAATVAQKLNNAAYLANVTSWGGPHVSETEAAWDKAIQQARSVEGVMIFDEAGRTMGGMDTDNKTSGGAYARGFGKLLNAITDDLQQGARRLYVLTANSIDDLPPELMDRGITMSVPFPGPETRFTIWKQNLEKKAQKNPRLRVAPDLYSNPNAEELVAQITADMAGRDIKRLVTLAETFGMGTITVDSLSEARGFMAKQADIHPEEIEHRREVLSRIPSVTSDVDENQVQQFASWQINRTRTTQEGESVAVIKPHTVSIPTPKSEPVTIAPSQVVTDQPVDPTEQLLKNLISGRYS